VYELADKVKYLGVLLYTSLKNDNDMWRQLKSICCAADMLRGTFAYSSTAIKTLRFMPMYAY